MFIILASEKNPRGWKEPSWRLQRDQKWWWKTKEANKKDLEKNKDDDEDLNGINEALKEIGAVCD